MRVRCGIGLPRALSFAQSEFGNFGNARPAFVIPIEGGKTVVT